MTKKKLPRVMKVWLCPHCKQQVKQRQPQTRPDGQHWHLECWKVGRPKEPGGRPTKPDAINRIGKHVHIVIPADLFEALARRALDLQLPIKSYIVNLIADDIAPMPRVFDATVTPETDAPLHDPGADAP